MKEPSPGSHGHLFRSAALPSGFSQPITDQTRNVQFCLAGNLDEWTRRHTPSQIVSPCETVCESFPQGSGWARALSAEKQPNPAYQLQDMPTRQVTLGFPATGLDGFPLPSFSLLVGDRFGNAASITPLTRVSHAHRELTSQRSRAGAVFPKQHCRRSRQCDQRTSSFTLARPSPAQPKTDKSETGSCTPGAASTRGNHGLGSSRWANEHRSPSACS